ncbi:MAG: acetate--CoA ligase family protein [Gemmatimonadales bacterium]
MADEKAAKSIGETLERALAEGRSTLLEPEGYALASELGIATPAFVVVKGAEDVSQARLAPITGERAVVKVVSPAIVHKSDVGGVRLVPNDPDTVIEAIQRMERRLVGHAITGYSISEFIPHSEALGGQLLIGLRQTADFGPVVTLGPGGVLTEWLSEHLEGGRSPVTVAPGMADAERLDQLLQHRAFTGLVVGHARGGRTHFDRTALLKLVQRFLEFTQTPEAELLDEFEINPLVPSDRGPMALDVLARLRRDAPPVAPARPLQKLRALLEPKSIAIMGVSERVNPGRTILRNTLGAGFPREAMCVIKPHTSAIEGVRCYPDLDALPERIDLLVLSIAADQVPGALDDVIASQRAESVIVIPGGLGERSETTDLADRMEQAIVGSRATSWRGPVVNGGNCLGILSHPGRYDATFIPEYKLDNPGAVLPLAIISQSGAFGVARASKLAGLQPRYSISVGNQTDLTVGDFLTYLKDDPEVEVFACYVEGFRSLDGRRWLEAAQEIAASGRHVVLYRAGRTPAGSRATASHTAAIAGDYAVARELATAAGVTVADSLADFDDLVRLFCYLRGKRVEGWRLGAVSNAGFECVATADNLGRFTLASFSDETVRRLEACFERSHIENIVDARNPVDLTPITNDEVYEEAVRCVMADDAVDVGVIGCVPLTPALQTLEPSAEHHEDLDAPGSIVNRLARLGRELAKPWIAVVDAGPRYDVMRTRLLEHGVPTFQTVDRALRLFELYCRRMTDAW